MAKYIGCLMPYQLVTDLLSMIVKFFNLRTDQKLTLPRMSIKIDYKDILDRQRPKISMFQMISATTCPRWITLLISTVN